MTGQPARARDRGEAALDTQGVHERAAAPARDAVTTLAWALAYVAGAWVGQQTVTGNSDFAMAWPASGVALAWVATSPDRLRALSVGLVGMLAAATAYATDGSVWATLDELVGVPLGLLVFLALSRRWTPGPWDAGGSETGALRQYGLLLAATIPAGLTEGLVALVALLPEPGTPFQRAGELALTHTIAMATVGVTLLVLGGWLVGLPATTARGRLAVVRRTLRRRDLALAAGGPAATVVVLLAGYLWLPDAPVGLALVILAVIAAIRFGPTLTAFYVLAVASAACWFTAVGHGPVAAITEPHRRALAFGIFTTALVCTGLTIAFSRHERDLTIARLRESERAAEVLADDLALVLANLEEGVAVVEQGGRFVHANPAMDRLLAPVDLGSVDTDTGSDPPPDGYRLTDSRGQVLAESDLPHTRAFTGEREVHEVVNLARPGGPVERVFEVTGRLLPQTRSGDRPRVVTTVRDVTAEHQQRDALASFAQVVAHDLRSPLTSVELWATELADTLGEGPVDAETAAMMLGHIQSAAGRMQRFIGDLLAYALSRDQTPSPTRIELTDVVEAVVETITAVDGEQPDVRHHGLPAVWADPVLLPQVFDNLIGNARKYVAAGVVPRVRVEAEPASDGWTRVRVIDNGIGIAPEDRVRVFETFERARATEYDGTGLGLAICRHVVERHGGSIGVTTPTDGAGTCIELTLPLSSEAFESATTRAGE